MSEPKTKAKPRGESEKLRPPADSPDDDAAADMLDDADHMGRPLIVDAEGNIVSGDESTA